jgi:hypothetical protein
LLSPKKVNKQPVMVKSSAELSHTEMCFWTGLIIQSRAGPARKLVVFSATNTEKCCFVARVQQSRIKNRQIDLKSRVSSGTHRKPGMRH